MIHFYIIIVSIFKSDIPLLIKKKVNNNNNILANIFIYTVTYPDVGPKNITRFAGEDNVFIPCPTREYLPVWEIDGHYYDVYSLPPLFVPAFNGIIIPVVHPEMNETSFRCIYSSDDEIKRSSIGFLIVKWSEGNKINITRL